MAPTGFRVAFAAPALGAAALVAALAFAAADPARAQQQPLPPPPPARVIVTGEGSVRLAPDFAEITGGVTTRAKTAKEASDANGKLMIAVTAALLHAGIAQTDVQTAGFSVAPVYAPRQPNAEPKLTGFSVSNQVAVKVRQIAKLGDILDALIAAGATDVGNVQFLHSDTSKALDQARQAAMADARRKAEIYAKASGLSLGSVAWVTEDSGYAPAVPAMVRFAATHVPIAAGENTLRVTIIVGFEVAP